MLKLHLKHCGRKVQFRAILVNVVIFHPKILYLQVVFYNQLLGADKFQLSFRNHFINNLQSGSIKLFLLELDSKLILMLQQLSPYHHQCYPIQFFAQS